MTSPRRTTSAALSQDIALMRPAMCYPERRAQHECQHCARWCTDRTPSVRVRNRPLTVVINAAVLRRDDDNHCPMFTPVTH